MSVDCRDRYRNHLAQQGFGRLVSVYIIGMKPFDDMAQAGGLKKKRRSSQKLCQRSVAMTMDMHFGPRSAEGWVELGGRQQCSAKLVCYVTLLLSDVHHFNRSI